ncbi:zinc finger protein rotund-like [Dendroctonus ponderosae]|uniref:zinc finger protein rotund-like n=1 Tax=Dendroctonus ponderosae TaxID=77166 RepID=UPI002034C5CA|nr:zinc finger protein rotund-like [Dendroctonus ponderosae]XP_048522208.1 zinc finger protein rotund-like [Dendroctonus ponderosae]
MHEKVMILQKKKIDCGQHGKDDYPNWTRNTMGMGKQGYESKMNEHNQMQKVYAGMEDHHMANTPGLYTSGRSTSSSSSPGVPGSSPALLVVPQPINATKMGGMQNGGVQPRKYQCKMCPQVRVSDNFLLIGALII